MHQHGVTVLFESHEFGICTETTTKTIYLDEPFCEEYNLEVIPMLCHEFGHVLVGHGGRESESPITQLKKEEEAWKAGHSFFLNNFTPEQVDSIEWDRTEAVAIESYRKATK